MASPGENENNSNENNTSKPVSNIFGSSTKSSISNLFTPQENTSDSFNDPSSSHINFAESSQGGLLFDNKPVEGDSSGEQPPAFRVSENSKSTDATPNDHAPERSPSLPGEKKEGVVLVTLSERIDPSLYGPAVETVPSNTLSAYAEQKSDDSQKPTEDLAKSAGLFSDTPRDEGLHALSSTQVTETVAKENDSNVTSYASLTQGQEQTQKDQLTGLDNDLLTGKFGTSGLLPPQTFSSPKTFDLVENEHTSKMTEPSVSSNAVSLTESINGQGTIFGDANKPSEFSTEGLTSNKETTSVFGTLNSTGNQTNLFGSTSPSTLFGNQEAAVNRAPNDTGDSLPRFGSTAEVKSEQTYNEVLSAPGTSGGTTNLFGSAASSATNLFGSSSTNIFGSAPSTSNAATGSIFASSEAGAKSSMFGSAETAAKGSLFGNINTSSSNSVFRQTSATTGTGASDANETTTVPTVAADNTGTAAAAVLSSSTNLFGTTDKKETSTTSNSFGTTGVTGTGTSGTSLFGSSTSGLTASATTSSSNLFVSSSPAPAATTNIFSAPSVGSDPPAASSTLFGTTDSVGSSNSNFFGTTDATTSSNLFGTTDKTASTTTSNLFGTAATATDTSASASNLFGSTDKTATSNLFGSTDKTTSSNLFGTTDTSSTSNLFGQSSATSATASAPSVNDTATGATGSNNLFGTTGTSSSVSNLFAATDSTSSSNLFGKTDTTSSTNLFGTKDATSTTTASNLFGTTDKTTSSNLFDTTDKTATTSSNLFGTTDKTASTTTSNLFGTAATATDTSASASNLFGTTTTTTMDKPSTSDLFKTTQAPASTTTSGASGSSFVTPSAFGGVGASATEAGNKLTSATGLLSNDKKTESLLDSTKAEQSKPRVTFNLPSEDASKDAMKKTEAFQQVDEQGSMATFSHQEQLTIGNLLDNWEKNISEKVRTFNSFADRVATIDQQILLQCNNINGLLNMHKELLEKHKKMENLMKVIEEEQKMALTVLDKMEKVLSGKLDSLNRRSSNYNVTQAITRNLQELTDQLASTTKATENIAQVCQPEPIFTIAKILSFHQISLIDLEKQCDEIDSRIRSMQKRV
ncbi:conserved hypothetical protein [Theileria orientalis strain Shintoku]|uniref:Nucleoporin NSP1-like C-terminal domain-containing protein n=1 Tax=Theileria orientalis strain Shintoku TaxID=869250 RepID=J4CCW2_THEOR|nr:conserved hypothetical protein [Theileria orientalis strain Shintoku]BAM40087.1 conserved hypothetical protein [Theileria orientalis strain Shintoku]|eukprot:XP_009690388.1 conserved hypothetical protein [Theileria orientalis strain Shintoku]